MKTFLQITVIVSAVLLTILVLMQNQGSGLGSAFGGETNFYRTKRGAEKVLFVGTIVLAVVFAAGILALLTIK